MDQQSDYRRNAYKERNRFKPEEVRRRRENMQVEIRKQKKEENLAKRRNLVETEVADESDEEVDAVNQQAEVCININTMDDDDVEILIVFF